MSLRVTFHEYLAPLIQRWGLPEPVFIDVRMRLRDWQLAADPLSWLQRDPDAISGLVLRFPLRHPTNRLLQYLFSFDVVYTQNEETLVVENGSMLQSFGFF